MSITCGPAGQPGFHRDPKIAKQTIANIRKLEKSNKVFVALAHDSFLVNVMPEYPDTVNGWSQSEWNKKLEGVLAKHYK